MDDRLEQIYDYEETDAGELKLLGVKSECEEFVIPESINGKPVVIIGEYCFARKRQITSVSLPDSIRSVESYAFYNCRGLKELEVGKVLCEVHGDAFMNCTGLRKIKMRAKAEEATGLPYLLNQLNGEIEVWFETKEQCLRIVYPEYTESYEEIGPAHIFALHVEGEGFRARKQFKDGILDFAGYDQGFEKATSIESVATLAQMAVDRLSYPFELKEEYRRQYEDYLKNHEEEVLSLLVDKQEEPLLQFLCQSPWISRHAIENALQRATAAGWTRGCATMLRSRFKQQKEDEDEYAF